ncbi:MAG: two-component sensor histidine kinase [Paucibacter sp.]|nr:two-component sensor histidine kinase [Roseateles sp.]
MRAGLRWLVASLRRRLLLFLSAAVVVAALLQGWTSYRTALAEADQIFDHQMQQVAVSLGGGLGGGVLHTEDDLELMVQAWSEQGLQVFQSAGRARLPARAVLGFANVNSDGHEYRVLSAQAGGQIVQVAQDMAVRRRLAGTLALRTITPIAVMLPLLMLVVGWVVSSSLAPVERVRRQLAQREAQDLAPVSSQDLPAELQPMVGEFNELLGRVQRSFEAQQHFVADAAHELRSPLTALKLQLQGLQRAGDEATRGKALARLDAGIERASRLVEQLLLLAREEAARPRVQAVAMEPLMRQAVAEQAAAARERDIDLGLVHADPASVDGQADALAVLVRNLLENAIKYSPRGGKVDASLTQQAQAVQIRVEDSGPGIAPEERARVFDRFYRSVDTAAAAGGSGLGLAIVKSIAQRHGATLRLDSSPRLGGLRVEVSFPLHLR